MKYSNKITNEIIPYHFYMIKIHINSWKSSVRNGNLDEYCANQKDWTTQNHIQDYGSETVEKNIHFLRHSYHLCCLFPFTNSLTSKHEVKGNKDKMSNEEQVCVLFWDMEMPCYSRLLICRNYSRYLNNGITINECVTTVYQYVILSREIAVDLLYV